MGFYRKKPVIIEAIEWDEKIETLDYLCKKGMKTVYSLLRSKDLKNLRIKTLEGEHIASKGDMIIKGVHGEFYPCKPDIFEKTYEKCED